MEIVRENILIKNCIVLPMTAAENDGKKYYRGNIGITGGRIALVGESAAEAEAFAARFGAAGNLRVIDGSRFVAMPGLVNLHNHVSMALMRSYADDMPLMRWLKEKIWPFEARLTPDDIYLGAKLGIAEMLLGGTTTFVDMYLMADRVAEAVDETGIRAVVCPTFFDDGIENHEPAAIAVIERFNGRDDDRITVRIAPHAPYTNSPDTIRKAVEVCKKYGVGIHVHLSETLDEAEIIRNAYGKTPTEYLADLGLFDVPTLAVHCVHLSETDMDILLRHGVSVGHNPQSNMKLASGIAPVARMIERGITVGIGTDGPSSNNDLDMWDEMRTASLLQKVATGDPCVLPAYHTLQMATCQGARALGMEGRIGVLVPGARADVILIDTDKAHLTPQHDLISNLVYCGKASDVNTVIVDGRTLVENRQLLRLDVQSLCRAAEKRAEELVKG